MLRTPSTHHESAPPSRAGLRRRFAVSIRIGFCISLALLGSGGLFSGRTPVSHAANVTYDSQTDWNGFTKTNTSSTNLPGSLTLTPSTTANAITVGTGPQEVAVTPDGTKAVVANSRDTFTSIVDMTTHAVTNVSTGTNMGHVAITPDGTKAVVAGNSTVATITLATNAVVTASIGAGDVGIAITSDSGRALINGIGSGYLYVLDLTNNSITSLSMGTHPTKAAFTSDGTHAYVATTTAVKVIDLSDLSVVTHNPITGNVHALALSPDGGTAVITDGGSMDAGTNLWFVNLSDYSATAVTIGGGAPTGGGAYGVAITPDGSKAITANFYYGGGGSTASIVDMTTHAVTTVTVGESPENVLITPDGSKAIVTGEYIDGENTAAVINLSDNSVNLVTTSYIGLKYAALTPDATKAVMTNIGNSPGSGTTIQILNLANDTFDSFASGYPASGTGTQTLTPVPGVQQHWTQATPSVTTPASTGVAMTYSIDNSAYVSDITTLGLSDTLYIKATLSSSDTAKTPSLDSLSITYVTPGISGLAPTSGSFLVGAGTGAVASVPLNWTVSDTAGADHIRTSYSTDNGGTWTTLSSSLATSATSDSWTPPSGTNTSTAKVKVEYLDSGNAVLMSATSGAFSVVTNAAPTASPSSPANAASPTAGSIGFSAAIGDSDAGDTVTADWRLCSDSGCATVVDHLDAQSVSLTAGVGTFSATRTVAAGSYWWEVRATDSHGATSGWSAARTLTATTPNTPPTVGTLGPSQFTTGGISNATQPTLTFVTADVDAGNTVLYTVQISTQSNFSSYVVDYEGALIAPGAQSFTVGQSDGAGTYGTGHAGQTLADGTYYWRVQAMDNSAATSSWVAANGGAAAFTVDATAPAAPAVASPASPVLTGATTYVVSGTAEANALVTVKKGATTVGSQQLAGGATSYSITVTLTPNATNSLNAYAADAAGNLSSATPVAAITSDTLAPAAPSVTSPAAPLHTTATSYVISGSAEANALVTVKSGPTAVGSQQLAGGATSYSITVPLTPLTTQSFVVYAADPAGNVSGGTAASAITQEAPTPAPTPVPTPAPTPSPTPTPSPIATVATASPSPSPAPVATVASATPTPVPSASPNETPAPTPAAVISNVSVVTSTAGTVITFTPPAAATVEIFRSTSPDAPGTLIGTTATGSFTDTAATEGAVYYYTLYAVDPAAPSDGTPPPAPVAVARIQSAPPARSTSPIPAASADVLVATGLVTVGIGLGGAISGLVSQTGDIVRSLQLLLLGMRPRRRKPWGTATEKKSGLPILGVPVVLLDSERHEVDRTLTDRWGEFSLLAPTPGSYFVALSGSDYPHPTLADIVITDPDATPKRILLTAEPSGQMLRSRRRAAAVLSRAVQILDLLRWPLLIVGTGLAAYYAVTSPGPIPYAECIVYAAIWIQYGASLLMTGRSYGTVRGSQDNSPIFHATVVFFASSKDGMSLTPVKASDTDQKGRYRVRIAPGTYVAKADHAGFSFDKEGPLSLAAAPVTTDFVLIPENAFSQGA